MRTCTSSIYRNPRFHYSWLQPDVRELDPIGPVGALQAQRYWAEDFLAESRFNDVEAVIHVDAASDQADPVAETRWIQAFNDRLGVPHAHVARCDLSRPDAGVIIDRHREYPVLRGVRDLRYDGYLTDAAWRARFRATRRYRPRLLHGPAGRADEAMPRH